RRLRAGAELFAATDARPGRDRPIDRGRAGVRARLHVRRRARGQRLRCPRARVVPVTEGRASKGPAYFATAAASISGVGGAVSLGSEPLCLSVSGNGAPLAIPKPTCSPANSA